MLTLLIHADVIFLHVAAKHGREERKSSFRAEIPSPPIMAHPSQKYNFPA